MEHSLQWFQLCMEWGGGEYDEHVKACFVREFGENIIFKFSLFAISFTSVWYQAICSTIDSLVSLANLVNLGTFHPLESYACNTYLDKGDMEFGLCSPTLWPFWARTFLTMWARLFCPLRLSCWTFLTTSSTFWFLPTIIIHGLTWPIWFLIPQVQGVRQVEVPLVVVALD